MLSHIVLALLWILYCLTHSVLAAAPVKSKIQIFIGNSYKYYRLAYNVFALLTLALILWYQVRMDTIQLLNRSVVLTVLGILISLSGLLIMVVCIKKYFLSFSGLDAVMNIQQSEPLMISGIHKYVRHPLYLGTFMFIWGIFLVYPTLSWVIADSVITIYTLIGIEIEEKKLVEEFGDQYKTYKKRVPKLIPRLRFTDK